MRHKRILVALALAGCARGAVSGPTPPPMVPDPYAPLPPVAVTAGPTGKIAVDSLLATLTVRQKVGQLLMPWLLGNYAAYDSEEYDSLAEWVDSLHVGGIIISVGPPLEVAAKLNALQRRSRLPLLVAADLEWGTGMRLRGGTEFPMPMALGAIGRPLDAYTVGRITAEEARAVGIHLTFSPVADVNSNPANPIINTRSFGESAGATAELAAAWVRGAADHGLFTTAKHFPGHGDTETDSHIALPVVRACWDRLDSLELVPFRSVIEAGVTAVMTAHVALPCVVEGTEPATLSPRVMTDILRDSLGFDGLVVTDALDMGALVAEFGPGETAVRAFLAGSDLLLMPGDLRRATAAMVDAVEAGRIPMERLDASVRRLLRLKEDAGLFRRRTVPLDSVPAVVGRREAQKLADEMAQRSLTLVRRGPLDEFRRSRGRVAVITYAEESNLTVGNTLIGQLRRLGDTVNSFRLFPASGAASYDSARTMIAGSPRTLFAVSVRFIAGRGHIQMPDSLAALVTATATRRPTLLASLGSPYLLSQVPGYAGGMLLAWSDTPATERAVAGAVAGGAEIRGRLPITLGDSMPAGYGIVIPRGAGSRGGASDHGGFDPGRLEGVRRFLEAQVEAGAFPGGVLVVGHRGAVAYHTAVGRYGEHDDRPVSDSTVYDMASLTKVIGLTTAAMLLVAEGRLDLDRPVREYVPRFRGPGKDGVLVRHLLTHTSGLPAWAPLYEETETPEDALARVLSTPLDTTPGSRYVYSDLGAITMAQVVQAAAGEPLDVLLERRVFRPLGMRHTRFLPPPAWLPFIAPTERDPWRGRLLHGEVHDENAARLGGVSGHAGLFSNGPDLARFARWLLDQYAGRDGAGGALSLPADVVRRFVARQPGPGGSTRALGWDTPSADGGSSAGTRMSLVSFGHTGFTGTSIWLDPEREVFIILLTNRVHPTRENRAILGLRGAVADSVMGALVEPPGVPR